MDKNRIIDRARGQATGGTGDQGALRPCEAQRAPRDLASVPDLGGDERDNLRQLEAT